MEMGKDFIHIKIYSTEEFKVDKPNQKWEQIII